MENIFRQSAWHVLKLKSQNKMCAILKKYLLTLETTQEILVTDGGETWRALFRGILRRGFRPVFSLICKVVPMNQFSIKIWLKGK